MKIGRRLAAAAATLGCMHAHAQTSGSVTLYGTVDTGIIYSTNQQFTRADGSTGGGHAWQMGGGNLVPSRFGFQGAEPLGGANAVFTLEQQFLSANGQALQGGTAFSRQAWVGLRTGSARSASAGSTTRTPTCSARTCRATTGRRRTARTSATSTT